MKPSKGTIGRVHTFNISKDPDDSVRFVMGGTNGSVTGIIDGKEAKDAELELPSHDWVHHTYDEG